MKTFAIEVKETLSRIIEVDAESVNDAISEVKDLYKKEKIILDSNDYVDTEIEPYLK